MIPLDNCKRAKCSKEHKELFDYLIKNEDKQVTYIDIERDLDISEWTIRILIGFLRDKGLVRYINKFEGYAITQHKIFYGRIKKQ